MNMMQLEINSYDTRPCKPDVSLHGLFYKMITQD